ncbi:MAG TPA: NAD+ synthase [Phycisphaerae bacterium]|nr:NAD+ synthase [Phycisphaerae bacterium]HNU44358.1 NAD+ synthase [Phycisphaerae bacterium]
MRVALAQMNPTVGDIAGNAARIIGWVHAARARGAQLVVFPELAVFGYPPKDLLLRQALVARNLAARDQVAAQCHGIAAVVGYVEREARGTGLSNAAAFCADGRVQARYAKRLLPTYDVFDETRYFTAGTAVQVVELGGDGTVRVGLTICEDLWNDEQFEGRRVYGLDPVEQTAVGGARWLINISASPFEAGKQHRREHIFAQQAREHRLRIIAVNQVGGNDDLLFDGASVVVEETGQVVARGPAFEEHLLFVDLSNPEPEALVSYPERVESIRRGLVLGTRDYVRKCGFSDVVLGLSGGIDSAVTAALAVEALGAEHVHGVAMPSRYSSAHSLDDARALADNLEIELRVVPIEGAHRAMEETVLPHFGDRAPDITEENIQARIRGNILMALSNKFGWLLLTTGNKSELGVGYCTLYGDMSGGLAVLSDVPKTAVYELARRINATAAEPCIPENSIRKPPSAELKENQCDQDTLPPYEMLDAILEQYVERERSVEEIVAGGFDRGVVERVARLVDHSEYKRRQAPVGLKVTSRAFGTGRRMPIAARCS